MFKITCEIHMRVDLGISSYGHTLNRSQSRVLRTMLLLSKTYPSLQSHASKKLRTAHQNLLRNQKSLLGETIWGNNSSTVRFHQNLKNSTKCTRILNKGVQIRFSTKSANFRLIFRAGIWFVEIFGVDIYVVRNLKCRVSLPFNNRI